MKLTDILNEILYEIGDTVTDVSDAQFTVEPYYGVVKFNFENANYTIDIDIVVKQESKIALVIDFYTGIRKFSLVGHNKPLQLMAFIVSAIETWLLKYKEKYNYDTLEVVYIKYDPKAEKGEKGSTEFANKRDKLYRLYINNFAKKYNSTVEYLSVGGITAKFNPKLSL